MQNGGSTWAFAWSVPVARQPGCLAKDRTQTLRGVVGFRSFGRFPVPWQQRVQFVPLVRPDTMRSSTSLSQANGSTSFSFADWIRVAMIAQCFPPLSEPANKAFSRPRATGRMARSTVLVSSSRRPSSRNRISPLQWFNAYRIAWARAERPEMRPSVSANHACIASMSGRLRCSRTRRRTSAGWPRISSRLVERGDLAHDPAAGGGTWHEGPDRMPHFPRDRYHGIPR